MKPELMILGESQSRVVVVDGITGDCDHVRRLAAELAPFPPHELYYPGLRRLVTPADQAAHAYMHTLLRDAMPYIGGAFGITRFNWIEGSFSMVTQPPEVLGPRQRAPHIDTVEPNYLAVLHYLSDTPGTGTAFYRQRSTGIERVTANNFSTYMAAATVENPQAQGYINGSNTWFDKIGQVEARPDRLIIYEGCLLHSGIIPADMSRDPDPLKGRLTANLFVRGH
ncbi:MAG: DUF6445 family protein [Asticcacaulis sp.]